MSMSHDDARHPRPEAKSEKADTTDASEDARDVLPLSAPRQLAAPILRVPPRMLRLHKDAPLARYGH
ncbi:MAG TPA: hypothetical protein VFN78_04735 [Ktedonobacterales bacterium]|nr:hypothetical protein [Ktedonobacterales bacterium]